MIFLRRSRHFTIIHMYMLSSGLSKHLRVMPSSFFEVSLFLVEGSRDFWHWFSGPFPYSISPSSSPYLHKPGSSENDRNSKNTFQGDSFANKSDSCSTYTFWGGLAPINIDRSSNCWRYMIQVSLSGAASDAVVIHVIFYARSSIWSTWSSIWSLISDQPYLIFVIFFTWAKFLENKIYTEKTRRLRQNTQ